MTCPATLEYWRREDGALVLAIKPTGEELTGPVVVYLGDDVLLDETVDVAPPFVDSGLMTTTPTPNKTAVAEAARWSKSIPGYSDMLLTHELAYWNSQPRRGAAQARYLAALEAESARRQLDRS